MKLYIYWIARLVAALIMLQTLYFKFSGAEESVYIFSQLGMEPWGRYGTGIAEFVAAGLLLISRTAWIGGALSLGIMLGAMVSHLTILGIEVQHDGGQLFIYALLVMICSLYVLYINRETWLKLIRRS